MGALPYDVYVFDLDGTLTESEPGITKSALYALERMGIHGYKREDLRFLVGPPLLDSFENAFHMSEVDAYRAIRLYQEHYSAEGYLDNSVYPGIVAMLRTLKAQGAYLAVATAKPEKFTVRILAAFGLDKYFDAVAAPRDEDETPYKARLIRRVLPENYRRACMVGDRKYDITAGKDCGIDAVGVLYGYGSREELEQAGADIIAQTVEDLTRKLTGDMPPSMGKFITVEGSDGCGKSTQMDLIRNYLALCGHEVIATREPGGCKIAERIRGIVLDAKEENMSDACEALLFAAARAQHVYEVIRPALEKGKTVLCDRFVDSSMVYQGAGRGLGGMVRTVNEPAVKGCMPDLTILLNMDPKAAMARRMAADAPDRIEKEKSEFVEKVYRAYLELAKENPARYRVVDAVGTPEEVFDRIKDILIREI